MPSLFELISGHIRVNLGGNPIDVRLGGDPAAAGVILDNLSPAELKEYRDSLLDELGKVERRIKEAEEGKG